MNTTKKINVNFSSLVGLKAELLRKQLEVKEAKVKIEDTRTIPKLKRKHKKIKDENVGKNSQNERDVDDINAHKKSKLMLEAKARLYDRLKKSRNNNDNFLVDFTNKSDESEEDPLNEEDYGDRGIEPEDNWAEYVDCFGRTRKCLREDLPLMWEKDEFVKQQIMKSKNDGSQNEDVALSPPMQKKEPEIEIMRRKWDEQTQKLAEKVNIHYQDVLFDEARSHGVGYYAFSQDEEQRTKQQDNLANLRKETVQKQREMKELKDLKEKMEQNRLKAARIRQRIRAGLPAEPTKEELDLENIKSQNSVTCDDNISEKKNNSTVDDHENKDDDKTEDSKAMEGEIDNLAVVEENKIQVLGELLGKRNTWQEMSQEEWVDKCRKERKNEFAPSYNNFKSAGFLHDEKVSKMDNKESQNDDKNDKIICDSENVCTTDQNDELSDYNNTETTTKADNMDNPDNPDNVNNSVDSNDSDTIGPMPHSEQTISAYTYNMSSYNINYNVTESQDSSMHNVISTPMNPINPYQMPVYPNMGIAYPMPYTSVTPSLNLHEYYQSYMTPMPYTMSNAESGNTVNTMQYHSEINNTETIASPSITATTCNTATTGTHLSTQDTTNTRQMNEETIAAGLRYLREKFEESKKL